MTSLLTEPRRPVPPAALDALRGRLTGVALTPGDPGFAAAARIWNPAAAARPLVIVQCASGADVAAALRFAREQELPVAVRAGGRHPAGYGSGPGLVLDLRPMAQVHVDPLGRTALVGGGATWGAVDAATAGVGATVPGVPVAAVGVAGSTLDGGFGLLARAYGLACDNLVGADLVLADGSRITTSGDQHPELLWGLRGGGGNFGVVTALRFRIRPAPRRVFGGTVLYRAGAATAVLRRLRDAGTQLPVEVGTRVSLYSAASPAVGSRFPGPAAAAPTVAVTVLGPAAAVAPLVAAAMPLAGNLAERAYPKALAELDDGYPAGDGAATGSWFVPGLPDPLVAALVEAHAAMSGVLAELHVHHLGGAVARVGAMSTAVPYRGAPFQVNAHVRGRGPAGEEAGRRWLADTGRRLAPLARGGPHPGLAPAGIRSADLYGADRYLRLAALKQRFDPDNVFAGNQNVAPLG
jgi:FAD/FMN-containing dehydrogenase